MRVLSRVTMLALLSACATATAVDIHGRLATPGTEMIVVHEAQRVRAQLDFVGPSEDLLETSDAFDALFREVADALASEFGSSQVAVYEGSVRPRRIDTWSTETFPESAVGKVVAGFGIEARYRTTIDREYELTLRSVLKFSEVEHNTSFGMDNTYTRPMGNAPIELGSVKSRAFERPEDVSPEGLLRHYPLDRLADALADSTRAGLEQFLTGPS